MNQEIQPQNDNEGMEPQPLATIEATPKTSSEIGKERADAAMAKIKSAGTKISNFFSRAGGAMKKSFYSALAPKQLFNEIDTSVGKKAEQLGESVGKGFARADEKITNELTQTGDYIGEKFEDVKQWGSESIQSVKEDAGMFADFVKNKAERAKTLVQNSVEITRASVLNVLLDNRENILDLREKIVNQYDSVKSYSENAIQSKQKKWAATKKAWWNKISTVLASISESAFEKAAKAEVVETTLDKEIQTRKTEANAMTIQEKMKRKQQLLAELDSLEVAA